MILLLNIFALSAVFLFFQTIFENIYLLKKRNIILFLFEIKLYNFLTKKYPLIIITYFIIILFFFVLNILFNYNFIFFYLLNIFQDIFNILFFQTQTFCAGTNKLMSLNDYKMNDYYTYSSSIYIMYETQIERDFQLKFDYYVKSSSYPNLSRFNIDYIRGQNSVYDNYKNVFKVMLETQVDLVRLKDDTHNLLNILLINDDENVNLIRTGKYSKMLYDLKLSNSFKLNSIFLNFKKLGNYHFEEILFYLKVNDILILKEQRLGILSDYILDGFLTSKNFKSDVISSPENYSIYFNYKLYSFETYAFLNDINSRLDECLSFLSANSMVDKNELFFFLNSKLNIDSITEEDWHNFADKILDTNKLNLENGSIKHSGLYIFFNKQQELLFENEPILKKMFEDINLIFLQRLTEDSTMLKDIQAESKDLVLDFEKLEETSLIEENNKFFNGKILKKIYLIRKDNIKKENIFL